MKSKKKLIVALSIAGVVLLAAIVSVVAVLAAATQNVTTGVNVTYSVTDVSATVGAKYKIATDTAVASNPATVAFAPADATTTKNLELSDISLTSGKTYVTFEYMFKNDAQKAFKVYLKGLPTATNMNITYATSTTAVTDMADGLTFATCSAVETATASNQIASVDGTIGSTTYVYIKVSIADLTKAASFVGDFAWELNSSL